MHTGIMRYYWSNSWGDIQKGRRTSPHTIKSVHHQQSLLVEGRCFTFSNLMWWWHCYNMTFRTSKAHSWYKKNLTSVNVYIYHKLRNTWIGCLYSGGMKQWKYLYKYSCNQWIEAWGYPVICIINPCIHCFCILHNTIQPRHLFLKCVFICMPPPLNI